MLHGPCCFGGLRVCHLVVPATHIRVVMLRQHTCSSEKRYEKKPTRIRVDSSWFRFLSILFGWLLIPFSARKTQQMKPIYCASLVFVASPHIPPSIPVLSPYPLDFWETGFPRATFDDRRVISPVDLVQSHYISCPWFVAQTPIKIWANYVTGWWYTYPSEKYEFVSWDDDIPNIWEKTCSKPPTKYYIDSLTRNTKAILG